MPIAHKDTKQTTQVLITNTVPPNHLSNSIEQQLKKEKRLNFDQKEKMNQNSIKKS